MAISPRRVFTGGRARTVEQSLLRQDHERTFGVLSAAGRFFRFSYLLEAAAEVQGCGARALRSFPGNRNRKSVVDFIRACTETVLLQLAGVSVR